MGSKLRQSYKGSYLEDDNTTRQDRAESDVSSGRPNLSQLLEEVDAACAAGKYEVLEVLYRRVLALNEKYPEAWYGLGMLSLQSGRLEEAYDYLSEYTAVAEDRERAEKAEVTLFFLECLVGGGEGVPIDIQEELDEQFVAAFSEHGWLDEPLPALGGLSPREVVRTRAGKARLLALLREMECFQRAVGRMMLETR